MTSRTSHLLSVSIIGVSAVSMSLIHGCSGPQPLSVAIRPADETAYNQFLQMSPQSPKQAFYAWKSHETGKSLAQVEAQDMQLDGSGNPFSARTDHQAVSRGAVVYKLHCASCHGDNADGRGPALPRALDSLDFHAFSKRFAVTLHGGAPRAWYRKISEGMTSETLGPDGKPLAMPPFGDVLAREQIWLAITYLQSLDMHAQKQAAGE